MVSSGPCQPPAPPPKRYGSGEERGGDFELSMVDPKVLNRITASVESLAFIQVSPNDAATTDNWDFISDASLRTLKVTTALSRKGENAARLVVERLRRFSAVTTLQFHENWNGVSCPFLPQPDTWIDELCSLVTAHFPLVICLECADLDEGQLVKLLSIGQLKKLALKYNY